MKDILKDILCVFTIVMFIVLILGFLMYGVDKYSQSTREKAARIGALTRCQQYKNIALQDCLDFIEKGKQFNR